MLRKAKILLIIIVSLWGFISAYQNIADWNGTIGAVNSTTSMTTFDNGEESFQATSNPLVVWMGALFILLSKLATGFLCSIGALRMWRAKETNMAAFQSAKQIALGGCAIAMLMLFGGFIVIAEGWFELWRSESMRGPVLESAFRYAAMIALIAIFVSTKDELVKNK
ncbi:MAG: putative small integral membrane protein [Polaribacter sp.]|jgi:predicted small integral membrane protein